MIIWKSGWMACKSSATWLQSPLSVVCNSKFSTIEQAPGQKTCAFWFLCNIKQVRGRQSNDYFLLLFMFVYMFVFINLKGTMYMNQPDLVIRLIYIRSPWQVVDKERNQKHTDRGVTTWKCDHKHNDKQIIHITYIMQNVY